MFPPFTTKEAREKCLYLIEQLEKGVCEKTVYKAHQTCSAFLKQVARESVERKNQGVMIGCLVCRHKITNEKIVLFAVSGNAKELVLQEEFCETACVVVPPVVSQDKIDQALQENDLLIHQLTDKINSLKKSMQKRSGESSVTDSENQTELLKLIKQRTQLTDASLQKVFELYTFFRFDEKPVSLKQIIEAHEGKLPPTGTGDCCAPKLLTWAFSHALVPLSMDEVFYGTDTNNKKNKHSYPPCDERCGYILPYILGLEIIYRDEDIVVVNKPSGLLSVPGRGPEKYDSVETRLRMLFPSCIKQPAVHRLDMETSGLMILALNQEAHKKMNMQFAEHGVQKKYVALLDGVLKTSDGKPGPSEGHIELKFRLDIENRPHQIYDEQNGKLGITDWKLLAIEKNRTRIEFIPHTGRTHQLRLAASDKRGLGIPIVGDSLYGSGKKQRLLLHACEITFTHPSTGKLMHFECKSEF